MRYYSLVCWLLFNSLLHQHFSRVSWTIYQELSWKRTFLCDAGHQLSWNCLVVSIGVCRGRQSDEIVTTFLYLFWIHKAVWSAVLKSNFKSLFTDTFEFEVHTIPFHHSCRWKDCNYSQPQWAEPHTLKESLEQSTIIHYECMIITTINPMQ